MSPHQPIYWHQGLFLQPQHFQHNDALHRAQLAWLSSHTQPHAWGVAALNVDEEALQTLTLNLRQLSMRLRDGTVIEYPGNAVLEPRTFDLQRLAEGRTVYVGVPRLLPGQANVQEFEQLADAVRAQTRFAVLADPEPVADAYGSGAQANLKLLHHVLRLFWDDEVASLGQYELIPLFRVEPDADVARLSRQFIPPSLNIGAAPALLQLLRQVRDEVIGRARQLEVFKPTGNAEGGAAADSSQANLWLALAVLNRHGPMLHHLIDCAQTHPWQIWVQLSQLVGELSTFSERYNLFGETRDGRALVPAYQHDAPASGFSAMVMLVRSLLNELGAAPEMMVPLEPTGAAQGLYSARLPDGFFGLRHRYHLMVRGEFDAATMIDMVARDAKLGAPDMIETLVTRSLPGVEVLHLAEPPRGIPRRTGALYFRIDPLSDAWEAVQTAGAVTLFLPGAPDGLLIEIIVTKW